MKDTSHPTEKLYDLLHTLGKKWSIELMHLVKKGSKSYTQLQKELGINSKLVSTKIKELMELHIIKKEGDRYDLSKLGKKVFKKIKPLTKVVVDFANELKEDFNDGAKKNLAISLSAKKVIAKKPVKKTSTPINKTAVKKAVSTSKPAAKNTNSKAKPVTKKVSAPLKAVVKKIAKKVAPKKAIKK